MCALRFLPYVFRRCESGIKHLSTVTVATPLVWGMSTRGEGGERERVRKREMASREIGQNERRQEARWRDDQIKTCGSLRRCPKGSHLSPPPFPHTARRQLKLCNKTASPLSGQEQKWLWEPLLQTEVSYYWPRVCAITHHGGQGLSLLQQLATALINTLLFTH